MIDIVLALLLLHAPDGTEVHVNPASIVSLRPSRPNEPNKLFTNEAQCLVNLSDGKYVAVTETCETVSEMMEQHK